MSTLRIIPVRRLYGHNGIFHDRLGPLRNTSTRASLILHTLSDGCEIGSGIPNYIPRSLSIRSESPTISNLLHESLIGSSIGRFDDLSPGLILATGSISEVSRI